MGFDLKMIFNIISLSTYLENKEKNDFISIMGYYYNAYAVIKYGAKSYLMLQAKM